MAPSFRLMRSLYDAPPEIPTPPVLIHEEVAQAQAFVEFILENLDLLLGYESVSKFNMKDEMLSLCEDLSYAGSFFRRVQENSSLEPVFSDIGILPGLEELLDLTDSYITSKISFPDCFLQHVQKAADLVRRIKSGEKGIFDVRTRTHGESNEGKSPSDQNDTALSSVVGEKIVIGFEDEKRKLIDRLIRGRKQLEVIPIIGMAGIGKTTLASTLYNHPSIAYYFHIRAWTSVSQSYQKGTLLRNILSSIVNENGINIPFLSEDDAGEMLYKSLMGNRYLVVIDDIWDVEAWNDLERYIPKNENGSRILMTSRIEDAALNLIRPKSCAFYLRFLNQNESFDLFKRKVFGAQSFPEELMEIGKKIVASCKGLPLAIVVIAGILAEEEKTQGCWMQVAANMGSSIHEDMEQLMDTLALSYKHLPNSLKSCFLYIGSFPEDHQIQKTKLIRSWVAEGFIEQAAGKTLEDVAEDYLVHLVERNLIINVMKGSNGGIKSCQIHDLLRDLCLKKAKERKFVQLQCKCRSNASHVCTNPRVFSTLDYEAFYNCQYFHFRSSYYVHKSIICNTTTLSVYKRLRVLDLRHLVLNNFPEEILQLLHLKYLALQVCRIRKLPASLFELWKLQTFILDGDKGRKVELTPGIMKMVSLRHFQISQELFCDPGRWLDWHSQWEKSRPEAMLDELQTISQLSPSSFVENHLLSRTRNLRKLGLHLTLSKASEDYQFPNLVILNFLETLKFEYHSYGMVPFRIPGPEVFPPSLKKLTLIGSHADWREMATIAMLPNLEVLKLKDNFFSGPRWETSDGGFPRLKFLKLSHMDLQEWTSYDSHFPELQHLVLNGCLDLEEIPSEIGDILTLQTIDVYRSSDSVVESVKKIQETQNSMGNDDLKVYIYQHFQEYQRSFPSGT